MNIQFSTKPAGSADLCFRAQVEGIFDPIVHEIERLVQSQVEQISAVGFSLR